LDIIRVLLSRINGGIDTIELKPWFVGYTANDKITVNKNGNYELKGIATTDGDMLYVTEIPATMREKVFRTLLDKYKNSGSIVNWHRVDTDTGFMYEIKYSDTIVDMKKIAKELRLTYTIKMNNMHVILGNNADGTVEKFPNTKCIIDKFYEERLKLYDVRKAAVVKGMELELTKVRFKYLYIKGCIDGVIDMKRDRNSVIDMIETNIDGIKECALLDGYKFLLDMPMRSTTIEVYEKLKNIFDGLVIMYKEYKEKPIKKIWSEELEELKTALVSVGIYG
jgi:DNA topoisomerase-2